jgi:8-oxo-dGTP pyrophosphatase MutT (NUDIX family)
MHSKISDIFKLALLLKQELPGHSAHRKMIPTFPGDAPEYFNHGKQLRDAAVLIALFEEENRLKTVFIERMPDPGPHSGQIAFPGGRIENADKDLIDTAIREAFEETGISAGRENVIGTLTPVQIPISGFSVLPVICVLGKKPEFIRCEVEVQSVFTADLIMLLEHETIRNIVARGINIDAPCFVYDEKIIWGATAMVLRELKEVMSSKLRP